MPTMSDEASPIAEAEDRDTLPGSPRNEGTPTGVYVSPSLVPPPSEGSAPEPTSSRHEPTCGEVAIGVARDLDARIRREVALHPYRAIGIAAAIGFAIRNAKGARSIALLGARAALGAITASAAERAA